VSKREYKHSTNGGQTVAGKKAMDAAKPAPKPCCECGKKLDEAGKCKNSGCKYYGQVPVCT
jgi:hypothetical protein